MGPLCRGQGRGHRRAPPLLGQLRPIPCWVGQLWVGDCREGRLLNTSSKDLAPGPAPGSPPPLKDPLRGSTPRQRPIPPRSEERRVGKESKSRRSPPAK